MFCPNCGYEQFCSCPTCAHKVPNGHMPEEWTEDGNGIICANCGLTACADWWEDLSITVVLKSEGVKTFAELAEKRKLSVASNAAANK